MDSKPHRQFLQIHLITAIILMFVGGGLIFLNSRPTAHAYYCYPVEQALRRHLLNPPMYDRWERGWPFRMNLIWIENEFPDQALPPPPKGFNGNWSPMGISGNALIALAILYGISFLLELLLRSGEARKS